MLQKDAAQRLGSLLFVSPLLGAVLKRAFDEDGGNFLMWLGLMHGATTPAGLGQ